VVKGASTRTAQAWCRKALWKARRTGSLPRKLKAMLETPPLILQPGHSRLISRVALQQRFNALAIQIQIDSGCLVLTLQRFCLPGSG